MAIAMTEQYSEDTQGAKDCLERSFDLVDAATAQIPAGEVARLADYGCADGGTALGLYERFVEAVRDRVGQVELVLSDLPSNDFDGLAQTVARMDRWPRVFPSMVPRSFFQPVTPQESVDLGFAATAMHWLSARPDPIPHHTHANACGDHAVFARFAAASADDWAHILALRAAELKPGGHMVTVNLARDAQGHYLGHNGRDENMHDVIHEEWAKLRDEGQLTEREYVAGTFQNFYRSEEELTAPFADDGSARAVGLVLERSRIERVPCPYRARFEEDGDVERFADGLMRTVRSWSRHTFSTALRERPDGETVVDLLYERLRQRYQHEPRRHSMDYVQSYLHFRKEAGHVGV